MIKLGQKVRDTVTGFEGTVIGMTRWLNGCTTVGIKAKIKEDGTVIEALWVDEPQVEVVKEDEVNIEKDAKINGGPLPSTPTRSLAPR